MVDVLFLYNMYNGCEFNVRYVMMCMVVIYIHMYMRDVLFLYNVYHGCDFDIISVIMCIIVTLTHLHYNKHTKTHTIKLTH